MATYNKKYTEYRYRGELIDRLKKNIQIDEEYVLSIDVVRSPHHAAYERKCLLTVTYLIPASFAEDDKPNE